LNKMNSKSGGAFNSSSSFETDSSVLSQPITTTGNITNDSSPSVRLSKILKTRTELSNHFRQQMILDDRVMERNIMQLSKEQLKAATNRKIRADEMRMWLKSVQTTTLTLKEIDMDGSSYKDTTDIKTN